jgi:hypothetical protein
MSKLNKVKVIIVSKDRRVKIVKGFLDNNIVYDKNKTFAIDVKETDTLISKRKPAYLVNLDFHKAINIFEDETIGEKTKKTAYQYGAGLREKILGRLINSQLGGAGNINIFNIIIIGSILLLGVLTWYLNSQVLEKLNDILKGLGLI